MRVGTLSKFNKKKNLWISRKHPLHLETTEFKTLYAAAIFMHARLNTQNNTLNNFEIERLITKGLELTSKETIQIMNLAKDVEQLVDRIVLELDTYEKKLLFLFDLYNVSVSGYNLSANQQKSVDLFANLLEISEEENHLIFNFISSAHCNEYDNCMDLYYNMKEENCSLTLSQLSYYMLNYPYTDHIYDNQLQANETYYFHGNCEFHDTIYIPEHTTLHISNAVVKIHRNFVLSGGTLIIENSWVDFPRKINSSSFEHAFISANHHSVIKLHNTNFQCYHNGGLLHSVDGTVSVEHCTIKDTSFISAIVSNDHNIYIAHCNFKNCFSRQNGGAISIHNGACQIHHCSFVNCNSHIGGGIYAGERTVITNCYFDNCCAVTYGSAIYYNGEIRSNVDKCEHINCYPKDEVIIQYIGGIKEYVISKETFLRCSTIFDCPVVIKELGILQIENASIYLKYTLLCKGILNMKKSKAKGYDLEGRDLINFETPKNCHFLNCEFDGMERHGIFRAVRARLHIKECIFRNSANGRAIYNAFLPKIDDCIFSYCQGGAVYCNSGEITNSKFINCRAKSGGGIIMYGSRGKVEHCDFHRCTSNYSGGAIDVSGSYHIVDCFYKDCKPNNVSF